MLAAAFWAFDLRAAQQVATLAIASDLRLATRDVPRFAVTLDEATMAIMAAAGRLHFRLTGARAAGASIEERLAAAQSGGELKA